MGLEAIRATRTVNEIAQDFEVHPAQVAQWKKEIQDQAASLFDTKSGRKKPAAPAATDADNLFGEIGRLKVELDWLKKKSGLSQ